MSQASSTLRRVTSWMKRKPRGSVRLVFVDLPANMNHFAFATAETLVQINVDGPLSIKYVNPADYRAERSKTGMGQVLCLCPVLICGNGSGAAPKIGMERRALLSHQCTRLTRAIAPAGNGAALLLLTPEAHDKQVARCIAASRSTRT